MKRGQWIFFIEKQLLSKLSQTIFNRSLSPNSSERVTILYGPTDPNIYHLLTPEQQILSTKATDKYQTFNRIILGIASLVDLKTLPAKANDF